MISLKGLNLFTSTGIWVSSAAVKKLFEFSKHYI